MTTFKLKRGSFLSQASEFEACNRSYTLPHASKHLETCYITHVLHYTNVFQTCGVRCVSVLSGVNLNIIKFSLANFLLKVCESFLSRVSETLSILWSVWVSSFRKEKAKWILFLRNKINFLHVDIWFFVPKCIFIFKTAV